MRFGFCAPWENAATIAAAGYDYIEPTVAFGLMPENSWEETPFAASSAASIQPEAFNVFLPGDLKIVGPEVDEVRLQRYLESAFERLGKVGAKVVVFGSAGARGIPEAFPPDRARTQIEAFLTRCAPLASASGVTVVIEPLNRGECNIINSVAEGMEYVRAVNASSIRVLSDLYHVDREGQSYAETRDAAEALRHVHVAGREGRRAPNEDDVDYLSGYFAVLKQMGYDGRISVEGGVTDLDREVPIALTVMRKAWEQA
jgi:sugar phosphate isomerase/epimerase